MCEVWVIKFWLQRCLGVSYFSLEVVDLDIGTLDSIVDAFLIMACSNSFPFHLICKYFGVPLFAKYQRLNILAVLDLASCISNFSNFLAFSMFFGYKNL